MITSYQEKKKEDRISGDKEEEEENKQETPTWAAPESLHPSFLPEVPSLENTPFYAPLLFPTSTTTPHARAVSTEKTLG